MTQEEILEKLTMDIRLREMSTDTVKEYVTRSAVFMLHFGKSADKIGKNEQRKDRLHQNYLRRKANGKQREYEERTKSEKRKKMDAKKAAIRDENIANGAYTSRRCNIKSKYMKKVC